MTPDPLKIAEEDFSFALEAMIRAKGYEVAPAAEVPAPNLPTASSDPERRIPQNDFQLKQFLVDEFGIRLPDTKVCEHHTTPFRAFADAYFARYGVTVWKASRGLGGKSYLLALLGHCEALTLDADVTILGGSGEQSARVLEYLQKWSTAEHNIKRRTLYGDGGRVTALMASSKSARGPHPQRMRLDECLARGSRVATPLGWRDIATLCIGDRVYSWHEGRITTTTIRRTWNRGWRDTLWCDIDGEGFYATPEHPVLSGDEWRQVQEAQTVQTMPWLWKADSCGCPSRPRLGSAVYGMLSKERYRSEALSMSAVLWPKDLCRQDLPNLSFCKQGSEGISLRRLWEATPILRIGSMSPMSFEVDEHDGNCAICSGARNCTRGSSPEQGGKSNGRTSNAFRIEIRTASSDQSMDCRFRDWQNSDRSSRRLLARSAGGGDQAGRDEEEISDECWLCGPILPNGSDALVVEKPLKTSQGPTLEVFDISTDTGSFIAWPGVVVHNCDEMDLKILDAAMGQPMASATVAKQTVMSSTHHYADKTFTEVVRRAKERGWPIYEWCYKESSASPNGWLSQSEIQSKRGEVTSAMWDAEYDLQEPSPEGRAILPEAVDACFKKELGEFEGKLGEEIIIEEWVERGVYAHGADWAKKKDFTIIDTFRIDVRPMRRVAWLRTGRMAWPMMIAKFNQRVQAYGGNACHDACVDDQTEIFTKRGWLTQEEVREGDEAFALNPKSRQAEWQPIDYIYRNAGTRPMVLMEGDNHSSLTTIDHKWLSFPRHRTQRNRPITETTRWRSTANLTECDRIPLAAAATSTQKDQTYSDDFVELVAWWMTEGWIIRRRSFTGGVSQSLSANPEKLGRLIGCLTRLYGNQGRLSSGHLWRFELRKENVATCWLGASILKQFEAIAPDKTPSMEFFLSLTKSQLDLFIDVCILGDGGIHRAERSFYQKHEGRRDAFIAACTLAGHATHFYRREWDEWSSFVKANLTEKTAKECSWYWVASVLRNKVFKPVAARKKSSKTNRAFRIETLEHTGTVWCPHLKHNNWLARRRGFVYFTGNTGLGDVVGDYQEVNAEGVILSGQTRSDVFSKYIAAIENGTIESPAIRYCEGEHRYCTNDDLTGSGHPPDSFVAGAMAFRAANKKKKGRVWVGV